MNAWLVLGRRGPHAAPLALFGGRKEAADYALSLTDSEVFSAMEGAPAAAPPDVVLSVWLVEIRGGLPARRHIAGVFDAEGLALSVLPPAGSG